jgi:hypothetical protein
MKFEFVKRCLKRDLLKDGLILVTTREASRDYWDLGRYSIIDDRRHLVERDVDIYDLAKERGLLPAQALI